MIKSKLREHPILRNAMIFLLLLGSFLLPELFGFYFLTFDPHNFSLAQLWPLAFATCWSVILAALVYLLPAKPARILYGVLYFACAVYAGFQTGYYILFSEMMWLSEFRYAAEGSDYASVLLSYPLSWWLGVIAMIVVGVSMLWRFPRRQGSWKCAAACMLAAVLAVTGLFRMPVQIFRQDTDGMASDYNRSESAQAVYENMFNVRRLYWLCGLYQTLAKDIYAHAIYPSTPAYVQAQEDARAEIDAWFDQHESGHDNAMTGLLAGKNVVLVLMESMDDWMFGEHTPTLNVLREEGIDFTNFYTPVYGGIRTFNTEFCINTGSYLSSAGGYAFDYVTNHFDQSLANLLRQEGYSAKTFHFNDPSFYSRGEFTPAMGYEEYVYYGDYLLDVDEKESADQLYDEQIVFDNDGLRSEFFRVGQPTLNFVITRSAHLSYKYNDVLSEWGLNQYPQYRGLTGNEETDCAYLKARLVDDFFTRLLNELKAEGQLENTVIIGVTDHYTYGYTDMDSLLTLSGVGETLLLEKTPCFIWSDGLTSRKVDKVLNTSDLLPTVLNLLGVDGEYSYIGSDAFDEAYEGFVPFSNGSWILGDSAYDAGSKQYFSVSGQAQTISAQTQQEMAAEVQEFIHINNLILETDYYKGN